jgi:hypothetical protein
MVQKTVVSWENGIKTVYFISIGRQFPPFWLHFIVIGPMIEVLALDIYSAAHCLVHERCMLLPVVVT